MTPRAADSAQRNKFGFAEWLRLGEHERVLAAIDGMRAAGASYVRTHLSWAEYHAPGGAGLVRLAGADARPRIRSAALHPLHAAIAVAHRTRHPARRSGSRTTPISSITC